MNKLHLDSSPKTPLIDFDYETGVLSLRGRSIPENSLEFFKPLNDWLEEYETHPKDVTTIDVRLEYFNTSSSRCILDLFKRLEKINSNSTAVLVNWYYEKDDKDMEEAGEDYQAIVGLPFKLIQVEEI